MRAISFRKIKKIEKKYRVLMKNSYLSKKNLFDCNFKTKQESFDVRTFTARFVC